VVDENVGELRRIGQLREYTGGSGIHQGVHIDLTA
jgi:hypothetical protein